MLIIVGAGPGIGASAAREVARQGFVVGMIARDAGTSLRYRAPLAAGQPLS